MMNNTMDNILKDVNKIVLRLRTFEAKQTTLAGNKTVKAQLLKVQADEHTNEAAHAARVAGKIEELIQ